MFWDGGLDIVRCGRRRASLGRAEGGLEEEDMIVVRSSKEMS